MTLIIVNPFGARKRAGYDKRGPKECWPWMGSCDPAGYGQVWNRRLGRVDKAHRVVYEMLRGVALPPWSSGGLELDHTCRNHSCVNPDHLDLVTHQENTRRRLKRPPPVFYHGTICGYNTRRCRCLECRAAWTAYMKGRRDARAAKR